MRRARTGRPDPAVGAVRRHGDDAGRVAVVLAGSWGSGLILFRDDVQVPRRSGTTRCWGLRRATAGRALRCRGRGALAPPRRRGGPTLLLAAPLLLAGRGVAVLLRRHGAPPAASARWRAGTPTSPSGSAWARPDAPGVRGLPWLVVAARASRRRVWLNASWCTLAFLPAALTPIGAVTGLVVLAVAVVIWRRPPAAVGAALAGPLLLCSTWCAGALAATVLTGSPDGAAAFAARDDTGWDTHVSVATLGGVWAPAAAPG